MNRMALTIVIGLSLVFSVDIAQGQLFRRNSCRPARFCPQPAARCCQPACTAPAVCRSCGVPSACAPCSRAVACGNQPCSPTRIVVVPGGQGEYAGMQVVSLLRDCYRSCDENFWCAINGPEHDACLVFCVEMIILGKDATYPAFNPCDQAARPPAN